MDITTILFDLDGTLLPMDLDLFSKAYIGGLVKAAAPYGYEPNKMMNAILEGTAAALNNQGKITNEDAFWSVLVGIFGDSVKNNYHIYDKFYQSDFQNIRQICGYNPRAKEIIDLIKKKGYRTALATNPIFPTVATKSRIRWAGLDTQDFELITTYENSHYCKPNPDYYREVLAQLMLSPEECLMVGNDVCEDMIASTLGMNVFLLTDCLINKNNEDISVYPHGNFDELENYINNLGKE